MRRRLSLPALAILAILVGAGFRHDLHMSSGRALIEERTAYARVRLFRDDLEAAIRAQTRNGEFHLVVTPHADSLVTAYAATRLALTSGGRSWRLSLVGSGEEKGLKPELDIWWIDFRFDAPAPVGRELDVRNELLFEQFRDQTNVMKFRLPDGSEKSVVFVPGEGTYRLRF